MPDHDASKKTRVFGPFELLEKVGVGGMGSVYKARRPGVDEYVALKIANRAVAGDPVLVHRFDNEFKIASQLQHPNLVRALGHGIENGTPYLVMEFVPGLSLDKHIKEQGPLPVADALAIFGRVGQAVEFIHQNHIIHRDIKPGNILLDPTSTAKLADLGLIKDLGSNSVLTGPNTGLGTFEYAAPEQFDDAKNADLRCDIYALAATLYVALTGKNPFGPGSQMRILMHKLEHQFTPLSRLIEGVSPALEQVINRSLHPDPAVRPSSIPEFLAAMCSTEPPKTVLTPKAPPALAPASLAETVPERRGGTRHAVQVPTTLGILNARRDDRQTRDSWPAQIMDISAGGLCLEVPRRFEAGTLLNVVLPRAHSHRPSDHLVRLRWIKDLRGGAWLIGCVFTNPLEDEDLDQFLLGDLPTTDALQKPKAGDEPEPPTKVIRRPG
jgi:serine/threonine protein kinase